MDGRKNWQLKQSIVSKVSFAPFNLINDAMDQTFDIILCNHVLIYFTPQSIEKTVDLLVHALKIGGILIVSPVEAPYIRHPLIVSYTKNGVTYFKKESIKKVAFNKPPKFEEIIPVSPYTPVEKVNSSKSWMQSLLHLVQKGEYEVVIDEVEGFLKNKELADVQEPLTLLIQAKLNLGHHQAALQWCEKGITTSPVNPELFFLHGSILYEMEKLDQAAESLQKALFLDPQRVMAHFFLGMIFQKQNKKGDAKRYFDNALSLLQHYPSNAIIPSSDQKTQEQLKDLIHHVRQR
jgi:chemotaxis protein methyltransferase CheR